MVTCGVCPGSKCISRVALGLPPLSNSTDITSTNTSSSSSSNGALIGGIVGGLFGGGLLLCGVGYFILKRRNKKMGNLPIAFRSKQHHLDRSVTVPASIMTTSDEEMQERAISGVIPVTFIPPSASTTSSVIHNRNTYMSRPDSSLSVPTTTAASRIHSFSTFNNQSEFGDLDDDEDPFSDRPISNAHSIMTTTSTNYDHSRRGSMESQVSQQQVAKVIQRAATQITRAKPQIMRVNTVKTTNNMTRQGSLKRIQPATSTQQIAEEAEDENPFDDKNKAEFSSSAAVTTKDATATKPTNSVMSAPGDGEITIFWNGS